jgi:hypothetical protein
VPSSPPAPPPAPEVVALSGADDGQPPMSAVLGCVNYETGMIFSQQADGLIGLGNAHRALPWQVGGGEGLAGAAAAVAPG